MQSQSLLYRAHPYTSQQRDRQARRFSFHSPFLGRPPCDGLSGPSLRRSSCQHPNASGPGSTLGHPPCPTQAQAQALYNSYLPLLTADLTQPEGPLLARGSLDPALGADFLQERGHMSVSVLAAFSLAVEPGQWAPRDTMVSSKRTVSALS